MSVKIKINWDNENAVSDSVRIYRADSAFTSANLPPLLAEIFGNVYEYDDFDVIEGQTYYYMLSAKLGEQEAFTECFEVVANTGQPLPNEIYFTTTTGTIDFSGVGGDRILLSDGDTITLVDDSVYDMTVPSGKHKIVLVEARSHDYVGLGGEALVEIHNFPTLGSVNSFNTNPSNPSSNLAKVPTTLPSNITDLQFMFAGATSFNQDISMWDMSNVTSIGGMFSDATAFNQPLNTWDVSNVNYMVGMFWGATAFNQPLNSWDVSNVTNMDSMFRTANTFNQDLSSWCVTRIPSKPNAFDLSATAWTLPRPVWGTCPQGGEEDDPLPNEIYFTTIAGNLNYFGVTGDQLVFSDGSIVTLDEEEVYGAVPDGKHKVVLKEPRETSEVRISGEALTELHNFPTTSSVTSFSFGATAYNLVKVPTVLPPNITYTSYMFFNASSFNQDISMWDTSNVIDMYGMFYNATSFNQDISMWNTSNVTDMYGMFYNATSFNQPLSTWNTSSITIMNSMFHDASSFNQDISMWNTSNVTDMGYMFEGASSFNQDLSRWCVPNISDHPYRFAESAPLFTEDKHPVWGTCPRGENLN